MLKTDQCHQTSMMTAGEGGLSRPALAFLGAEHRAPNHRLRATFDNCPPGYQVKADRN